MKIIVLGGGLMGVTTAWYLAQTGHEVTVIERRDGVARETSFANAGMIAPGHSYSWASPRAPMLLLKSLFGADTALRFRFKADPRTNVGTLTALDLRDRGVSGRLISVVLIGSAGKKRVSGDVFRSVFNAARPSGDKSLRSTLFDTAPIP